MKSLIVFTFVFAFHTLLLAQNVNTAKIVAHIAGNEEISLTKKFEFLKMISINLITGNKTSPSNLNYTLRYPAIESYMAMSISGLADEETESIPEVVLDFDEGTRITFMCFGDIKMARAHKLENAQKNISILNFNPGMLKETGNSKNILGYKSVEYLMSEGDFKGSIWITPSVNEDLEKPLNDLGLKYKSVYPASPSGYIMCLKADNVITNEVMQLNISDIKINDVYSIDAQLYVTTAAPSH